MNRLNPRVASADTPKRSIRAWCAPAFRADDAACVPASGFAKKAVPKKKPAAKRVRRSARKFVSDEHYQRAAMEALRATLQRFDERVELATVAIEQIAMYFADAATRDRVQRLLSASLAVGAVEEKPEHAEPGRDQ